MDSATTVTQLVAKVSKEADNRRKDAEAMRIALTLLPDLIEMIAAEEQAEGHDDLTNEEVESRDLFGTEPSGKDEAEASPIHARAANWYKKAHEYWQGISVKNRQRSQFTEMTGRYPSATAVKGKAATAADSKSKASAVNLVAANASAGRPTSAFARF